MYKCLDCCGADEYVDLAKIYRESCDTNYERITDKMINLDCQTFWQIIDRGLVWFKWHINLRRLFKAKAILLEAQQWCYLTHSLEDKKAHTFPKDICPKGNVIEYIKVLFTNPSARAGYDTRSIFKRSLTGLNSEFSFF